MLSVSDVQKVLQNLLRVPHPLHVHASNLGVPGNIRSTLDTIAALGEAIIAENISPPRRREMADELSALLKQLS